MNNLFEIAVRNKYRFNFKGFMSVEDLWDLNIHDLDKIFKTLSKQLKESNEESLLDTKSNEDIELTNKIEIIKHIVSIKMEEANIRREAANNYALKQKILAIKAAKQDAKLQDMSEEELNTMLDNLG